MDLAFHLRAARMLDRETPAGSEHGVDYDELVAALGAHQSRSRTAQAARGRTGTAAARSGPGEQVAEIVLGGGGWQEAKRAQGGSFHPGGCADGDAKLNENGTSG
jgi:hypothetical protein